MDTKTKFYPVLFAFLRSRMDGIASEKKLLVTARNSILYSAGSLVGAAFIENDFQKGMPGFLTGFKSINNSIDNCRNCMKSYMSVVTIEK